MNQIIEQLNEIAENEQKVYDAGYNDGKVEGGYNEAVSEANQYTDSKTVISTTEPENATVGTLWLDTSDTTISYSEGVGF